MEQVKLPPRLAAVASLTPPDARLADVGSDHGLLPVWLLQRGLIRSAVATDIRPGPLSRAEKRRAAAGIAPQAMRCVLCDGLDGVKPGEADTVAVAGLGGETITGILKRAPWVRHDTLLLLQPMTHPEILRRALEEWGLRITRERLVEDGGRIYAVLSAREGADEPLTQAEWYTGRYTLVAGEPLFPRYLQGWRKKINQALRGLALSRREGDARRLEHLRLVDRQMGEMEERYADSL